MGVRLRSTIASAVVTAVAGCGQVAQPETTAAGPHRADVPRRPSAARASANDDPAAAPDTPKRAKMPPASGGTLHVDGPTLDDWSPTFKVPASGGDTQEVAVATRLEVPLYARPGARHAIGHAHIGNRLPVFGTAGSCSGGQWARVSGEAYLCTGDGAKVVVRSKAGAVLGADDRARRPALNQVVPFAYAKADDGGPPQLSRLPLLEELDDVKQGKATGSLVDRIMDGAYLLALARETRVGDELFFETVAGHFVLASDLTEKITPPLHGGAIESRGELPIAFAVNDATLQCVEGDRLSPCGSVDKHARMPGAKRREIDGNGYVFVGPDRVLPENDVRVIEMIERPKGVDADEKWIHIDLSEQTLTAYEGDLPVYATLVSTGKPGHETKTGLYQVERKYVTKTMRGMDEDGRYVVEQVPWTMYYDGKFAIHGAYWHNEFGNTRSHGCVNVPPADARWLYFWADPHLPTGWHAMFHKRGAHVYVTGKTPATRSSDS